MPMSFIHKEKVCSYCGTCCNYIGSQELTSMVEMNKLRSRYKDTKTGVMHKVECDFCGTSTIRWSDEKIECKYCGDEI